MFLQKLELQGFKSFAPKTVLDFKAGITAIVGPNGSGKSNVVDAIKWLLGEREAKSLRGERADDLIFAGSEKKPRAGLAQVSIYFDNSTGIFRLNFRKLLSADASVATDNLFFCLIKPKLGLRTLLIFLLKLNLALGV